MKNIFLTRKIIKLIDIIIYKSQCLGYGKIEEKIYPVKEYVIKNFLKSFYSPIAKNTYHNIEQDNRNEPTNIFIYWNKGYDAAPDIVKLCIDSIKKFNTDKKIVLITDDTLDDYISGIPQAIVDKYKKGSITIQMFSDIFRLNLLKKYGGYWCDATIFCTGPINYGEKLNFFSIKNKYGSKLNIARRRWTTYFLYSKPEDLIVSTVYNALCYYVTNTDYVVDYFLTDYTFDWACNNITQFSTELSKIPDNNPDVTSLLPLLNKEFDKDTWSMYTNRTSLFKLSWKVPLSNTGNSFYKYLSTYIHG